MIFIIICIFAIPMTHVRQIIPFPDYKITPILKLYRDKIKTVPYDSKTISPLSVWNTMFKVLHQSCNKRDPPNVKCEFIKLIWVTGQEAVKEDDKDLRESQLWMLLYLLQPHVSGNQFLKLLELNSFEELPSDECDYYKSWRNELKTRLKLIVLLNPEFILNDLLNWKPIVEFSFHEDRIQFVHDFIGHIVPDLRKENSLSPLRMWNRVINDMKEDLEDSKDPKDLDIFQKLKEIQQAGNFKLINANDQIEAFKSLENDVEQVLNSSKRKAPTHPNGERKRRIWQI
eukprot:NODE_376_length_8513_cov_1.020086.p4 type:complete len:286 gc:universal NODE_376_length_8513_cov_1.020086:6752-5895(-)